MASLMDQEFGSSDSEGEDFNPAQHVDSDEDVVKPVKRKAKRASPEPSPGPESDSPLSDDETAPVVANSEDEGEGIEDGGAGKDLDEDDIDGEEEDEEEDDDEEGPEVGCPSIFCAN
jgi:transcription elongation factor SPT5